MTDDHFAALEMEMRQFILQVQNRLEGLKSAVHDLSNGTDSNAGEQIPLVWQSPPPAVRDVPTKQNNAPDANELKTRSSTASSKPEVRMVVHEQASTAEPIAAKPASAEERLAAIKRRLAEQASRRA